MTLLVVDPGAYMRQRIQALVPGSISAATFTQARQLAEKKDISFLVTELIDMEGSRANALLDYVRGMASYVPVIANTSCHRVEALTLAESYQVDVLLKKGHPSPDRHLRLLQATIQKLQANPLLYKDRPLYSLPSPRVQDEAEFYLRENVARGQRRKSFSAKVPKLL